MVIHLIPKTAQKYRKNKSTFFFRQGHWIREATGTMSNGGWKGRRQRKEKGEKDREEKRQRERWREREKEREEKLVGF